MLLNHECETDMTRFTHGLAPLCLVLLLAFPLPVPAQILGGSDTIEIADGIHSSRFGGGRSLWVEMEDSVVVFDPLNVSAATALRESIGKATDKPVSHVIYSHEHYDHIRGAKIFKDEGATIIAQENCLDTFDYVPDADAIPPDMTFADRHTMPVAGTPIELHYFGRNHGDCMTVAHFPEHRLVFIVDLIAEKSLPFGSLPDYYPGDTVRTLSEVNQLDFDRIAKGHRTAVVGREALEQTLGYWSDLMAAVKTELDKGTGAFDVIDTLELPQYRDWTNYDLWFKLHVERAMWHYVIGW